MSKLKNKKIAILTILFCMLLWGSAIPALKVAYESFGLLGGDYAPKIYFGGLRFTIAGLLIAFLLLVKGKKEKFNKKDLPFIIMIGLVQIYFQYIFYYIGIGNTSGIKSAILQSGSTFFPVILAHFMIKDDPMNKKKAIALVLGFSGIIASNWGKDFDFNMTITGEGFLLIGTLISSFGLVFVKKRTPKVNSFYLTMGQMLTGGILMTLSGRVFMTESLAWTPLTLAILLYTGFLSATAFILWYQVLQEYPLGEVAIFRLFIPIFGSLLSILLLPEEHFTIFTLLGLALVIAGMVYLNRKPKIQ